MSIQERIPSVVHLLILSSDKAEHLALARAVLFSAGLTQSQISVDESRGVPSVKVFFEEAGKIQRLYALFKKLNLPHLKITKTSLTPREWLTRWKDDWRPSRLTKKLDVVPVWCKEKYKPKKSRDYILMDTLLSFGTGLHETTQIVAQFIEDNKGAFNSFMDIGTGTGILAIVASKNGAYEVLAVDIGDLSVKAARDNMKVNGVKVKIRLADIKSFKHKKKYDFVAANLITHDLIDNALQILKFTKAGGLLAVSGVSLDNLAKLRTAFKRLPLRLIRVVKGKQWAGLLYEKKIP